MTLRNLAVILICLTSTILCVYSQCDIFLVEQRYRIVREDVGTIPITVASRATVELEAYLSFYTYRGAIFGVDILFQNLTDFMNVFNFTILSGATRTFDLTIVDDSRAEFRDNYYYDYERVYYSLGIYSSSGQHIYCDSDNISIEDNDGLHFEFPNTGVTVDEDVGTVELCVIFSEADNVPETINATITHYGDGAVIFDYYDTTFTISKGSRMCFDVIVIDDGYIEYTDYEYFYLRRETDDYDYDYYYYYYYYYHRYYDKTKIVVVDNEAFRFGLERSSYSVAEDAGLVTVCVTADRGNGSEVFGFTLTSIIITTQGEVDHGTSNQSVMISATLAKQCVNITITDDSVVEEDEFFQISITSIFRYAGGYNPYYLSIMSATVTIIDNDLVCSPECVNGVCRYPGVCQCYEGWIGEDCSTDICQPSCGVNGICNVSTETCDCSPGYTGGSCDDDINECNFNNGECDRTCTNFIGGHECSCDDGFLSLTADESSCRDIDECAETEHGCNQTCINTPGSYYCNCERGFQPVKFTECEDIDECMVLSPNGLCQQVCVNTLGSYHCDCMEGYNLFGTSFCLDIDECAQMTDNCVKTGLTPAKCVNIQGSYECSCYHHLGYQLSADDISCEDVNECNGTHICTNQCINTPGSYHCSCSEGFKLDEDGYSCHDIDECQVMMGGCDHYCTNTYGSFSCSCKRGHTLLADGLTCQALNCLPILEVPDNGNITCDTQTVGGTCNFSCDPGFTLRGLHPIKSISRTCLSSLQWNGRPAICDPPLCPELHPPSNGFVLFPCTREEGDVCDIVCAHGHIMMDPSSRKCELNATNATNDLDWTEEPICVESDPCSPNPCKNGGVCVNQSDPFTCTCDGTGYGGPTCEVAIITLEYIPPLNDMEIPITLSTIANVSEISERPRVIVTVKGPKKFRQNLIIEFTGNRRNLGDSVVVSTPGVFTISLPKDTSNVMYEPRQRNVLVFTDSGDDESSSYFQQFNLTKGLLKPGCCNADDHVRLFCPGNSTQALSLLSPCEWSTTSAEVTRTSGAVFVEGNELSFPTSIAGLSYRDVPGESHRNDIQSTDRKCITCSECENDADGKCYCYTHTTQETQDFLSARALAFTYITEIQKLLPLWLEMSIDLEFVLDSSPLTKNDMLAPITRSTELVSSIEGCSRLTFLSNSLFSVLRYDKTLSAVIDGKKVKYTEDSDTGASDDTMCFAVNLCHELDPPVHMQLSQAVNDALVAQLLYKFSNRQWSFHFNTISVFKHSVPYTNDRTYWNGVKMIQVPEKGVDLLMNAEVSLVFGSDSLKMTLELSGDAAFNYEKSLGSIDGYFLLEVGSMIGGSEQGLEISSVSSTKAYCYIPAGDPCINDGTDLKGVSFMAYYAPRPGEIFFSHLLRFNETTQRCRFNAYIPMNKDYNAMGLSLHTECPILALGELMFSDMAHTLSFIGTTASTCLTSNFLNDPSPALVIESDLMLHRLRLGNFIELHQTTTGPDITTVFGSRKGSGFVSHLYSVQVMLFKTVFLTEAVINNNQLEIVTTSSVFGYPADITITAPSNVANWQELILNVKGSFLPGDGGFIQRLTEVVVDKLTHLAESGNIRRQIAEMALNQSKQRFKYINEQYIDAEMNVTLAKEMINDARLNISLANTTLIEIESNFSSIQVELQDLMETLDNLCTEQICEDVCMPGDSCRNCTKPIFIVKTSKCPTTIKETKNIRIPPFVVERTTWKFVEECRLENNQICWDDDCIGEDIEYCYGKCVPITSFVPVYNWEMVEVDVHTFENCTIQVFNGSVPDTCCEYVDCAVFAPNATCVASNALCRVTRQNAFKEVEDIKEESRELFQHVLNAKMSLSLAITAEKRANIEYQIYIKRRDQLELSQSRLKDAVITSQRVYNNTLQEIEQLLRIYNTGQENGFDSLFTVTDITFNEYFTTSPTSLALIVLYVGLGSKGEQIFVYDSLKEENFERIADEIINSAFISPTEQSSRFIRQAELELTQRQIFDSRCAHVSNTQLFFLEIQTRLLEVQASIEASHEGATQLSQALSDQGPTGDEEFEAYVDLIRNLEDLSMEAVHTLENTIFSEWQASMELLYSESGSVGEVNCDGFADCQQTAVDELEILIGLTPKTELTEKFVSLLPEFPAADKKLLELALLSNLTIDEGLDRVQPIINITAAYATDNYWCNEPPVIITQPPPEVNISLGSTLQLLCEAESNLPILYTWERDGSVLPQFTTNELIISTVERLDSANYTCFASNPVGIAEAITTSVTVYELPEFYLTPESVVTHFGSDNGAWFACNATAWPYPGWWWFFRNATDQDWTIIEGENTNELLILNPQEEHEGMYACEAFNYHGSIRSEAVMLTLLPFTVSLQQFTVEFTLNNTNQFCSIDDMLDSLYSLLSETIDGETTIRDFNVTESDAQNFDVSMTIASENVTTHYLHLLTLAEIANVALPRISSLRKSVEFIKSLLEGEVALRFCSESKLSVVEDSLVVGKLTYVCPPGQRLNSDYLLCLSCELGTFSTEIELSRIANGVGLSENVPVCDVCPLDTYAEDLGSTICSPCPKYHSTLSTATTSRKECIAQPLVLECDAITSSNHVEIDCKTNRPPQKILCSFNNGIQHECSYPVSINRDVSPLGNHDVTISVQDDEGFQADKTIPYFLAEDSKPTVPAVVPPLVVSFINDSPRVHGDGVEADILLSRPVQSLICRLRAQGSEPIEEDCSSGHVVFSSLRPAVYILRVVATNRHPDKEFIKRRFEITDDMERCTLHLINGGVTITSNDTATVELTGRGPATGYHCHLDKMEPFECSNPVMLSGLTIGKHQLKVMPTGCGKNRMNLKVEVNIE